MPNNLTLDLANRFREVILNGTWIANTNWKKELLQTDFDEATTQVKNLNRICDLCFHIKYYISGINDFFRSGNLVIKDNLSFNCPPLHNESEWNALRSELFQEAEVFASFVEQLSEQQISSTFFDPKYGTYYRNIEAQIEHAYYHLGQIVLIKKLIQ